MQLLKSKNNIHLSKKIEKYIDKYILQLYNKHINSIQYGLESKDILKVW
jgi:hypothetical protein